MSKTISFDTNDVQILKSEIKYKGFIKVEEMTLKHRLHQGGWTSTIQREFIDRGDAVAVLAVDLATQQVVLTRQFRVGAIHSSNPWLLDVIAGMIEENETAQQVAVRESQEEVGGEVELIHKIGCYFGSAGACSEQTTIYLGLIDSKTVPEYSGNPHETEDIEVVKISIDELFNLLKQGEIHSASLLIGTLWLQNNIKQLTPLIKTDWDIS